MGHFPSCRTGFTSAHRHYRQSLRSFGETKHKKPNTGTQLGPSSRDGSRTTPTAGAKPPRFRPSLTRPYLVDSKPLDRRSVDGPDAVEEHWDAYHKSPGIEERVAGYVIPHFGFARDGPLPQGSYPRKRDVCVSVNGAIVAQEEPKIMWRC